MRLRSSLGRRRHQALTCQNRWRKACRYHWKKAIMSSPKRADSMLSTEMTATQLDCLHVETLAMVLNNVPWLPYSSVHARN